MKLDKKYLEIKRSLAKVKKRTTAANLNLKKLVFFAKLKIKIVQLKLKKSIIEVDFIN